MTEDFTTGWLAPISPNGPCFGTPLFTRPRSNSLFMQEISDDENIASFIQVDDTESRRLVQVDTKRSARVGDQAIYGVLGPGGQVIVGNRDDAKDELEALVERNDEYLFLNLSIAKFLRNEGLIQGALHKIKIAPQYADSRIYPDGQELRLRSTISARTGFDSRASSRNLLFATTRTLNLSRRNPYHMFTGKPSKDLTYGIASVSTPAYRQIGVVARAANLERAGVSQKIDRAKYSALNSMQCFSSSLDAGSALAERRDPLLLFVHGYRQSMASALLHAAQLAEDLAFVGQIIVFCWPSGSLFSGGELSAAGPVDRDALVSCLRLCCSVAAVDRAHTLVAHGSGCTLTLRALMHMMESGSGHEMGWLKELVLASPDVSVPEFLRSMSLLGNAIRRTTVYASQRDLALKLSGVMYKELVSGNNPEMLVGARADIVDTATNSMNSSDWIRHSDFSSVAIHDLRALIGTGSSPAGRGLVGIRSSKGDYWRLPGV